MESAGSLPQNTRRGRRVSLWTLGSLLLLMIACAMPALDFQNFSGAQAQDRTTSWGVSLLLLGWMGPLAGQFAWYANVFLLGAWILRLLRLYRVSALLALVALFVAFDCLAMYTHPLPADEGGVRQSYMVGLRIGFYFWIASMVVMVVDGISGSLRQTRAS
jgi:hypothetical protein